MARMVFEQAPSGGQFLHGNQVARREIEALASQSFLGIAAPGLFEVGEKIAARDLAFHNDGVALSLPSNRVGNLACDTGLFRKHDAAAVRPEPVDSDLDELRM